MRVRLFALLSAAALFALAAVPASAESEAQSYLALGDSVPFGFQPNPALWSDISNMVGYPEIVAQSLNIQDVNASCPGETSAGFLSLSAPDNGCRTFRFVLNDPLHVAYSGTQLAFATSYLRQHEGTRLVTLMIGANDVFLLQHACETAHPGDLVAIAACFQAGFPATLNTIATNLNSIFSAIRGSDYEGLLVAVTYYALDYADPAFRNTALALDAVVEAVAKAHGALIASGFDTFAAASAAFGGHPCLAGLLLPAFPSTKPGCDVHPSPLGRDLLAQAVVNTVAASCEAHIAKICLDG